MNRKRIRKAVIPAAGLGTRVLPATKAQPKEMLVIVDKPALQYLVEELVESGIEEILIVTGRNKESIENHFDYSYELEKTLEEKGIIHRKVYPEVPPRVEYSLTDLGITLKPVIDSMQKWGEYYKTRI